MKRPYFSSAIIIFIGVFSLLAASPVYAAPNFFGKFMPRFNTTQRQGDNRNDKNATESPKQVRTEFREENKEKTGTKTGIFKSFLRARAAVGAGTVTAINGTTLTITNKESNIFTIQTNEKTQYRRRFWGKGSFSETQVGDTVSVVGKWTDDTHTTILATLIRNLSVQKFMGVFFGTVQSVTSSGWVMKTIGRGDQTVTISSSTKLTDRKGGVITQADIVVGHRVRVRGLWDRKAKTVTEVTAVKDFSIPVVATVSVTPTPTVFSTITPTATPVVTPTATPIPTATPTTTPIPTVTPVPTTTP
jgi:hypothetical protein